MEKSDPILDGSKRFGTFREGLIKQIPRLPNDRASLTALRSKNHTELLIIYMSWRLRHVAVRARKVVGLSILEDDPRSRGAESEHQSVRASGRGWCRSGSLPLEEGASRGLCDGRRSNEDEYRDMGR